MLGEELGQEIGQVIGTRVLPAENSGPRVEVSFQANGRMLDTDMTDMGTYESVVRADGTLEGHGQGMLMTPEGESVAWVGHGVGQFTGHGSAVSWRGSLFYQTTSPRLARLNRIVGMFEYETDESGKTTGRVYEWK